jgi:hypothetical protein
LRKRKNRTIIKKTNAIMHDQNISRIPWEETCMTQYMCRTRVFTRLRKKKKKTITSEEVLSGMKPEIEHFKLLWCLMYFHVLKEKKYKLYPLERKDTMNLQRHSRSTSLVRDRLRQTETLSLKKR